MKAFQTGQDPLKSKAGLFESSSSEEIQRTEHSPTQETKLQTQIHNITIVQSQSDISQKLDFEAQTVSLNRKNFEESKQMINDGRVSLQRNEPELSEKNLGRMQLEKPAVSTLRSLSEDVQISPDRRPSEDFSADIKAELEESPEYQLFKQTSTATDVSYQLEAPEEETLADDSDTNPASVTTPCLQTYFGEDTSPESPKHQGMAESSDGSVDIRAFHSSSEEREDSEGLTVTPQMTTKREEKYTSLSQEEKMQEASKENTRIDCGNKQSFTLTESEETVVNELPFQEIHKGKKTSSQTSKAEKDMSGMLLLMNKDLDQYLQTRPVVRQPLAENIVQEKFEQVILTKVIDEEIVPDENEGAVLDGTALEIYQAAIRGDEKAGSESKGVKHSSAMLSVSPQPTEDDEHNGGIVGITTQETDYATSTHRFTKGGEEVLAQATLSEELSLKEEWVEKKTSYEPSAKAKEISGMLSQLNSDSDEHLKDRPVDSRHPEEDIILETFEQVIHTKIRKSSAVDIEDEVSADTKTTVAEVKELTPSSVSETPFQEVCVERMIHHQQSTTEKDMSGMLSLLSSDLDQHLKDKPVTIQYLPEEEVVHESCKQVIRTSTTFEDKVGGEANQDLQTDVLEVKELTPSSELETPFQEVCIEKNMQQSTTEKDMSGMLSLLSSDLDQQLKDKPVAIQYLPEEEVVHEICKQVIRTSTTFEDKLGGEENQDLQTDLLEVKELTPSSVSETPFQEVCVERMIHHQQSTTEKDMSGMLSLLSSDLDQHLKDKPVTIQYLPEEEVVHEICKQVIRTSTTFEDKLGGEENQDLQTDVLEVKELTPSSVSETPFQEVCVERMIHHQQPTTEKDMSGMLSLLSSDLDQHLKDKPVTIQYLPEEEVVHESCKQVIRTSTTFEDKVGGEENQDLQTDVLEVKELTPSSELETPFQEVCIEKNTQQSTTEKDMSGMLSLLSSDLDQQLKDKPVAIQYLPEEEVVHEICKQVIRTSTTFEDKVGGEENQDMQTDVLEVKELTPSSELETPFQEVCVERMIHHQQSTTEKDMSGMLSLLSSDLDQHLKDKPVTIQYLPEEEVVHESCKQVIRTSTTFEEKVGGEANQDMQTDVLEVKELTPSSELETPFQEVCNEKNTQQPTTEKDMSGMLSLLSSDLDQHLKDKPVAIQYLPEEEVVHEICKQVIRTSTTFEDNVGGEENQDLQTDVLEVKELTPSSELETPFQEVCIEKNMQQSTTEKDMSGMLSLLSSDLDQHLKDKPVAIQYLPEEEVVHEICKQVIRTSTTFEDKVRGEANQDLQTDVLEVKELTPSYVSETPFQEVCVERMIHHQQSTTEKDMSGMLSLLSSDLDQHLKDKPVAIQYLPEEVVVHEICKQVIRTSTTFEDKVGGEANQDLQTDVLEVKELTPSYVSETPFQEVCVERMIHHQQSTTEKDMSGMLSLLSSDLDQHLKDKPGTIQYLPEEEVVHEICKQVIRTSTTFEDKVGGEANQDLQTDVLEVKELTPSYVSETPFQEVCVERMIHHQQSTTEKDMSGMLSLLSSDLDQHLKDKPVAIQYLPEEVVVHEICKQVIRTSTTFEDKVGGEENQDLQTDVLEVKELTPSSELETPFQEVCIEKNTQQSTTEKDMSGMLSLLSSDFDQYFKEKPQALQCYPEVDLVHDSCEQIILTKDTKRETLTLSPEQSKMSPEDTSFDSVDINKEGALENVWQTCSDDDEGPRSFSFKEDEANTSPSVATDFLNSTERTVDIMQSYATVDDCKIYPEDASVVAFDSFPSSGCNTLQRPINWENLNTMVFDDTAKEQCDQDSLEASPLMEDRSSKKSPDSIDPSPSKGSPCPDSLEGSPTRSVDTEFKMPAKTAVYEDYASQLRACFAYEKSIYMDECEHNEQDSTMGETDGDDTTHKQFTPEEEMFKMAAKIKTFEEMEQESKMKRDKPLDATTQPETGDNEDGELVIKCGPVSQSISPDTFQKTFEKCVTESTGALNEATDISLCVKEKVKIESQLKTTQSVDDSLSLTPTHKEEPDHEGIQESAPSLAEREAEINNDKETIENVLSLGTDTHHPNSVTDEHHSDESPLTDGSGLISKPQAVVCSKDLEDIGSGDDSDVALTAQVKVDQINLCSTEDRQTPDKTLLPSSGDERSPDPFMFQEGKLFEMTRGGAIDMTRRTFDEEGEGYAFFHIGEHPVDEVVPEETEEAQTKSLTLQSSDSISDTTLQETSNSDLTQDISNSIPFPKPRTLIKPSSDKLEPSSSTEVQLGSPCALENLLNCQTDVENLERLGLEYLDSTIADLQSGTSTVAHPVYSEQSHDLSDSSPDDDDDDDDDEVEEDEEDQCSVIEMALSAVAPGKPEHHLDTPPPLAIKPAILHHADTTIKDSQMSEFDQLQRKAGKNSTKDRRTRSEAGNITKASNKDSRSYSDSSQPANKSSLSPSKLTAMMQQKPLAHVISSCSPPRKDIKLSKTTESSVKSSLDTDDTSNSSHRSLDSIIFTYDNAASHSSDSDGSQLPAVHPSCGTEDVFESRSAWDDTVETQMQRIIDDQTPECMPVDWQDDADRKEETLAIIADLLGFSWTELARELEFSEDDIQIVRTENPNSLQEQSHALLQRWVEREGKHATEECLIKRLTKINRMDIVHLIETQMNKSVQEQTSRTYAEIEKTLDHSEVSVALSSVQEDADSPRIIRRVESDRRPPPAVSEEDLSVASLLDIPSWAEPVGNTHSESMHGDLLEELEIPHELNPNLWTSEDIIAQEPSSHDNSDEQADEMPDLPTQTVTEEKYTDENGHIVVKKVTRKIIRKCVSADGVEREEMLLEGAPQGSISVAEGDGYSKVVKRTILKSEGDHTEVTFAECEGFSSSRQEATDGREVSHTERTTVVEGERTMTHQGDPSLASDLPSAQDDFKQGPRA
ncbi:ankyrin-2 isoform X1 [Embiotoca jacksoni]|uniref:ankyrin-2 isoform X1 n=1 Tax=Embiotoca jacksoni TaxID=100190 RepID=UPI003703AD6D